MNATANRAFGRGRQSRCFWCELHSAGKVGLTAKVDSSALLNVADANNETSDFKRLLCTIGASFSSNGMSVFDVRHSQSCRLAHVVT